MSPLDAHRRLLQMLPVRTHIMRNDDPLTHQMRTPQEHAEFREKARALRKQGWTLVKIAEELKISKASVFNYVRRRAR